MKFSALNNGSGGDTITWEAVDGFQGGASGSADLGIDNSGGPQAGNIYSHSGGFPNGSESRRGWLPNGLPIPDWPAYESFSNGLGVGPNGEVWQSGSKEGAGALVEIDYATGKINLDRAYMGLFGGPDSPTHPVLDSQGNFYVFNNTGGFETYATKFPPEPRQTGLGPPEREQIYRLTGNTVFGGEMGIDMSNDDVFLFEGYEAGIQQFDSKGGKLSTFGEAEGPYPGLQQVTGIAVDPVTHDVWAANNRDVGGRARVDKFSRVGTYTVPTTDTTAVTRPEGPGKATLHGVINADGVTTTNCYFKWGTSQTLPNTIPCAEGNVHAGSSNVDVSANINGLTKGTRYWYRLFASNANNHLSDGGPEKFRAQNKPLFNTIYPDSVNTDGVRLNVEIDPNGGPTFYHWEYGPTEAYGESSPSVHLVRRDNEDLEQFPGSVTDPYDIESLITGLTPNTEYHFRLVAENDEGKSVSDDFEFTTYLPDPGIDGCANSLVRQQTTSALLADCRAYELASTAVGGGYDVVSDLVPGDEPLVTSPTANDRLLYSMDSGVIPGIAGNPTNLGRDPYVATRTASGWTTRYVGLPADGMTDDGSYGSPLLGTDGALDVFAFGGGGICDPCFADESINVPLRLANGSLVKGMAGSSNPAADPAGEVRKGVSEDGSHFVFGSDQKFETAGNSGSVTIYDRNLVTGTTQVASTMPDGTTMTGAVAALDVSDNGGRILIGKKVGEDALGNGYFDLYMHIGTAANSVEVVDTASGVVFNGMTGDGDEVLFSTTDPLSGDLDTSTDLYRAEVGTGSSTVSRVSTGTGAGNTDGCTPLGSPNNWNSASADGKCGVLAFAGGAGLAEDEGTVYFLSPEKLDGGGELNQANLFVAEPGQAPVFVGVMDTTAGKAPPPPPDHPVDKTNFGGSFEFPVGPAVDQSNGDVYIPDVGAKKVFRFDAAGVAKNFSAGPGSGTNALPGLEWPELSAAQVAVDNSASPAAGDVYVVSQNPSFESKVSVFAPTGALLTTLTGTGTPGGAYGFGCGVAVDQANGNVYIGDYFGNIWRYTPAANPVVEANYSGGISTGSFSGSCQVAAANGFVYTRTEAGEVRRYATSAFAMGSPPAATPTLITTGARGVGTDPGTGSVYVTFGNKISVYDDDTEATLIESFGTGSLNNSNSLAVRSSNLHVFATTNNNRVAEFGYSPSPYTPIDHHAIVNALNQSEVHNYGDFQVSGNGDYAIFDSKVPLTGHIAFGHSEVYRYDVGGDAVACPSCAPTKAAATTDTVLPAFGLGLTEDGRVFFTTQESFVLRDSNGRKDAYQWSGGAAQLISRGLGAEDSGLLGVSSDGVDAFFFTRDKLVHNDGNGNAVKVYDAREGGGFPFDPSPQPCAASDECHGAGTEAPGPPDITSLSPAPTVTPKVAPKTCKKGQVKRKGKCVKKKKSKKSKKTSRKHG